MWDAASNACPSGWHLLESAEWSALLDEVGGKNLNYSDSVQTPSLKGRS